MLVDRFPPPSKLPAQLVCHWLKGSVRLVLCNNVHGPPAAPFVAEMDNEPALTLMPVMSGDDGAPLPTTICPEPAVMVEPP